jgi:hypothetical protein
LIDHPLPGGCGREYIPRVVIEKIAQGKCRLKRTKKKEGEG